MRIYDREKPFRFDDEVCLLNLIGRAAGFAEIIKDSYSCRHQ